MKLSVLYLGKQGAGCVYTFEMVKELVSANIQLQVILSKQIENRDKFETDLNLLNIEYVWIDTYENSKIDFLIKSANIFKFLSTARQINKFNPDWIYIPMLSLWAGMILPFVKKKTKIITTIHDVSQHLGEYDSFTEKIYKYVITRSEKLITLTKDFIPLIAQKYGKDNVDICWIKHANFNYYRPNTYNAKTHITNKILFFGRIHKYKGVSVLLDSMKLIHQSNPEIKLRIAGNGNLSDEDVKMINDLNDNVELINRWISNDEMYQFFEDIDIVIVPYIEASQSGIIMLSYTFGKPMIVTNVGGLPEQVDSSVGVVIPSNDSDSLSNAVLEFYKTPEKILSMGDNAYTKAVTDFSWKNSVETLISFIR